MNQKPTTQFGKREAAHAAQTARTTKRSGHVALLLAGTVAVGGGAYALMPGENCEPNRPGMASSAECSPRNSSGGHGSSGGSASRSSFYSGDSSSGRPATGVSSSEAGSGGVTRGGFGAFAHAFTSHFSGGG